MIEYFYFLRKVPLIGSLGRFILKKYDAICFRRRKRCFLSCGNEVLQKAKNATFYYKMLHFFYFELTIIVLWILDILRVKVCHIVRAG